MRTLVLCDREIAAGNGRWFQVKIMPCRTTEDLIVGVGIPLNDISRARNLEAQLRVDVDRARDVP